MHAKIFVAIWQQALVESNVLLFYGHTVHKHLRMNWKNNTQPPSDKRKQNPEEAIATLHRPTGMRFRLHWYGQSTAK